MEQLEAPGGVSVLGLGAMGLPMARRLAAAGVEPVVFNRTVAKAASLRGERLTVATSPAEAATAITLTVLDDLAAVEAVLEGPTGLLAGWRARGVGAPMLIIMGTVAPGGVRELGERLAREGVAVIDAPVSGGPQGAAEGRLSIMVGATLEHHERLQPILGELGATVRRMGPLGAGQMAKTCNQIVVAATMTALSEAFALAREAGVNRSDLLDVLRGGLAGSRILEQRGENWVKETFEPGGRARLHLKDFHSAAEMAAETGLRLTVTEAVAQRYEQLVAAGDGDLDHSAVFRQVIRDMDAGSEGG